MDVKFQEKAAAAKCQQLILPRLSNRMMLPFSF